MRQVDSQFHKIQREACLREGAQSTDPSDKADMYKSQSALLERLERKLANAEELNDICIENVFELQTKLSETQGANEQLRGEVQSLTHINGEMLAKTHTQSLELEAKNTQVVTLQDQVQELQKLADTQNLKITEVHGIQKQDRAEINRLRTENTELKATPSTPKLSSEFGMNPTRPIDLTERHILTEGAADKILNDLQKELQTVTREKEELQHQLQKDAVPNQIGLPRSCTHPKTEIYHKLLEYTEPLKSVMQYYQAYRALDLLASNLPILRRGITLTQVQFKDLWDQATSRAKDTLAFMWAAGDFKLPLGSMEIVTGSPPFFIQRYVLRSMAYLAQHKATQSKEYNMNQALPNLRTYTHSQKMAIVKLHNQNQAVFQQARDSLRREDTTICFEAVRRHQWLLEHYPDQATNVTLPQLKDYVTQTLEEQQLTISKGRFGTINHGTMLRIGKPDQPSCKPQENHEA